MKTPKYPLNKVDPDRLTRIHKLFPNWSDEFISEMLYCSESNKPCCNIDKHNYNDCDNCPRMIY